MDKQKNSTIKIIIAIVLIAVMVAIIYYLRPKSSSNEESSPTNENFNQTEGGQDQDVETEKDLDTPFSESVRYKNYSPDRLAEAEGDIILFFYATWCPTCNYADSQIRGNIEEIPDDVTILLVNFDTESALKNKHNVIYQHTFVQVDNNGNQIKKWSGSYTIDELLTELM